MTMSESRSLNIAEKDGWTAHDDSGVFVTETDDLTTTVTDLPRHGLERLTQSPPSASTQLPDRTSPRAGHSFSFPRHGSSTRSVPASLDGVRSPASLHGTHEVDADRLLSDADHMHMLFEDSGSHCLSIPEDSEGEEEEEEGDTGYRRATFDLPSSPGYMALSSLSSKASQPVSIPVHSRLSGPSPGTSGGTDSGASGSVFTFGGRPGATDYHTPPRESTSQPSRQPQLGGLSLSPVIECLLLRKMKNRLSGNFEEKSFRVSANLASSSDASEFRERANSESGGWPDAQAIRESRMARGRSQSAPSVEATLVIQRQQVGGALRIFGDQFNKEYEKKIPVRSPSQRQLSLRRQVLSCPTQHSLWENMMGKLP